MKDIKMLERAIALGSRWTNVDVYPRLFLLLLLYTDTCPNSFASMGKSCYKYFSRVDPNPFNVCNHFGSYVAVIDNDLELGLVFNNTSVLGVGECDVSIFFCN
jgi:hypothetical protein